MEKISLTFLVLVVSALLMFTKSGANFASENNIKMSMEYEQDARLVKATIIQGQVHKDDATLSTPLNQCVPCGQDCQEWGFGCCGDCDCQFNKCVFTT